jgi:hypothetical protein
VTCAVVCVTSTVADTSDVILLAMVMVKGVSLCKYVCGMCVYSFAVYLYVCMYMYVCMSVWYLCLYVYMCPCGWHQQCDPLCHGKDTLRDVPVWKVSFNCKFHFGAPYNTDSHLPRRARCTWSVCYTKSRTDSWLRLSLNQLWFKVYVFLYVHACRCVHPCVWYLVNNI